MMTCTMLAHTLCARQCMLCSHDLLLRAAYDNRLPPSNIANSVRRDGPAVACICKRTRMRYLPCHWTAGRIRLCEHILTVGCWGGGGGGGGGILTGGAEGL